MATESHAFAGWPLELDPDMYDMYLAGFSAASCMETIVAEETERRRYSQKSPTSPNQPLSTPRDPAKDFQHIPQYTPESPFIPSWMDPLFSEEDEEIILQDVQDHYRVIDYLLPYVLQPDAFISRRHLPISTSDKHEMIRRYFALDDTMAAMMFGSKLGKPEVEGLVDRALKYGYTASAVNRYVDNVKRLAKYALTKMKENDEEDEEADHHTHQGGSGGIAISLRMILERGFLLPPDLVSKYVTLTVAYEHHLSPKSLAFGKCTLHDQAAMCSAITVTWCDETELYMKPNIGPAMSRLKTLLTDSKVTAELHTLVFKVAPVKRWIPDRVATVVAKHTTTAAPAETTLEGTISAASGSLGGSLDFASSPPVATSPTPSSAIVSPATSTPGTLLAALGQQTSTSSGIASGGGGGSTSGGYHRRLIDAFPVFLKSWAKVTGNFGSKKDLTYLIDSLREKVLDPFIFSSVEPSGHLHLPGTTSNLGGGSESVGALDRQTSSQHTDPSAHSPLHGGGASEGVPPQSGPLLTPTEVKIRSMRELGQMVSSIGVYFPQLHLVGEADHKLLDSICVSYCMMLQLMIQLQLVKLADSSLSSAVPPPASSPLLPTLTAGNGGSCGQASGSNCPTPIQQSSAGLHRTNGALRASASPIPSVGTLSNIEGISGK